MVDRPSAEISSFSDTSIVLRLTAASEAVAERRADRWIARNVSDSAGSMMDRERVGKVGPTEYLVEYKR